MIKKARGRARARGLIVLTATPLLGIVVPVLGIHEPAKADGPVRVGAKKHYKASHRHRNGRAVRPGRFVINTTGPKSPILPGRTYNWPFAVTNKGPMRAGPAILKAPLPKSLEFVSGAANCSFAGNAAVCQLGSMKPGQTVAGVITAKVGTAVKPREAINAAATVSWARSSVSKAFPQVAVADTADISVTKTAPSAVRPGQAIPYDVTVRNNGPSTAVGVEIQSALPLKVSGGSSQACAGESHGGGRPHGNVSGSCATGHSEAGVHHSSGQVCAGENESMPNGQGTNGQGTSGQGSHSACVHGHSQTGVDQSGAQFCAGMPENGQNGTGTGTGNNGQSSNGQSSNGQGTNGQSSNGQGTNGQSSNGQGTTGENGTGQNGNENHAACASSRGESGIDQATSPTTVIESGNGCLQRSMSFVCSVGSLSAGEQRTFKIKVQPGKKIRPGAVVEWPSDVTTKTIELNLTNNSATAKTKLKLPAAAKAGMALNQVKPGKVRAHRPGRPGQRPARRPVQRPGAPIWHGGVPGGGMNELPRTGAESGAMFDASLGLIGVGLILTRLGRRSRRD